MEWFLGLGEGGPLACALRYTFLKRFLNYYQIKVDFLRSRVCSPIPFLGWNDEEQQPDF
jgi:hypothetical protein